MPRAAPPATADDGSSTAAAPEPSMTSVSTTTVTDPSSVNTESAGVEDAESSQGGKPAQLEPGNDLTAEEEALLSWPAHTKTNYIFPDRNLGRKKVTLRFGLLHRRSSVTTTFVFQGERNAARNGTPNL